MRQISNETDYQNPASSITLGHARGVVKRIGERRERSDRKMNRIGDSTGDGDWQRQRKKERCEKIRREGTERWRGIQNKTGRRICCNL